MEELTASMAELSATMHHGFKRFERMMVERDEGGMKGRRSSASRHDRRLARDEGDIPYFDGGHLYDWLDRAKYFFHVYDVPREARVGVASFHLEGTTRKWWMRLKSQFKHDDMRLGWTAFEHAFLERWGSSYMMSPQRQIAEMRLGTEEHDAHQEALHREDDEELEEGLIAPDMTDDMPPTQASAESHIEHGSVVP